MRYTKILALTLAGAALCIGVIAFAAPREGGGHCGHGGRMMKILRLTPEQRSQARAIFEGAHKQIQQVLTPAQQRGMRARGQAFHARRQEFRATVKSLHLSREQKAQLKTIFTDARAKAAAIRANTALATADRRAQLKELRTATIAQGMQLLSPAQQTQARGALEHFRRERAGMGSLGITPAQHEQLHAIREKARSDFRAILTPAQQQQLDAFHAGHPHHVRPAA